MGEQQSWAIVGGGMLGMTLALRLAQRGHKVALFEAADHLGGLADAWQLGDVEWDRHYHVTLLSDIHNRKLLAELDLDDQMQWAETKTGFFTDGQLYSMSNTLEFLRFPPLRLLDKLRLGFTIFYASRIKNWRRLEKVPVAKWLRRLSGRRTYEKIWLPLLRSKLGENYKITSAAFIWATIARMYAARRTGMKKEMFGYALGGYARIVESLRQRLESLGVQIHVGRPAREIRNDSHGVAVRFDDFDVEYFDRVAVTTPAPVIERLCPDFSPDEKQRLRQIQYQGIVCASVLLSRPLSEYYVTNITEDWVPFTGVIEMSALVDPATFGGKSLVYLPKYVPADDPAFGLSDDEIRDQFLSALKRMVPDLKDEEILAFRVSRVRAVCALSTLNYSQTVPGVETSLPGIYTVTSAQIVNGTLNVNETVKLAEDAIETLVKPIARQRDNFIEQESNVETDRQLVAGPRQ